MMKYKLVVLTNAVDGHEQAFNDWYDNTHLGDVLKIRDFTAAKRFKSVVPVMGEPFYGYCAIYDVETDNPERAIERLTSAWGTPVMEMSDALAPQMYAVLYQEHGVLPEV